jgi:hypothetical protein
LQLRFGPGGQGGARLKVLHDRMRCQGSPYVSILGNWFPSDAFFTFFPPIKVQVSFPSLYSYTIQKTMLVGHSIIPALTMIHVFLIFLAPMSFHVVPSP